MSALATVEAFVVDEQAQSESTTGGESVVTKVRVVIETLALHGHMSLSRLAREAGLSKTTVHRLTGELIEWGLVERIDGQLTLGPRAGQLGELVVTRESLWMIAHPFCVDFFTEFRIPVGVCVLQGLQARSAGTVYGAQRPEVWGDLHTGQRSPVHAGSVGKVILAYSSRDLWASVLELPLSRVTPFTTVDPQKLAAQMREVRRLGYAVERQEFRLGASSVAVPVFDRAGRVLAAIGAPLPARREGFVAVVLGLKRTSKLITDALP